MSYLKFDKTVMINLEESLTREVLRTNRLGAYHCTTVVDCNTRKYHGLLVMPVPAIDDDNHVLLSSFDETVIQHGAEFNLGLHKYAGDNFSPKGHKYIREYSSETVPRTLYRVGGVIFSKEKVFSMYENRIMIKYTLEDAHSATTLRFRPFLAFRSVKNLTQANGNVNQSYEEVTNGIKTCMYPGYPELYMQFNKKVKFVYEPYWYNGIEYPKEQERGYPYQEDLYVPGYFEVPIKKGETIIFSAGDSAVATTRLKALYENEVVARTPRTSFFNCLKNSAQQFYFRPKEDDAYLLAGYPWFKVRARDLFVALPGSTLSIDDPVRFEKIMHTVEKHLEEYPECKVYLSTPPVIPGLGSSGGFEMQLEARGEATFDNLVDATDTLMYYASKRKELAGLSSSLQSEIPQLYFDVDRDKVKMLGVPLADVFSTMKAYTGSVYVNDFNMFNRIYKVYIQAEAPYREHKDNINLFFVKASNGAMVPLTSLGNASYTTGPGSIKRFNMFTTAVIRGAAAQGYSSGQAMEIMEQIARDHLPDNIGLEWSGLSYQEKQAGGQTGMVMALVFLFVFLFLAAQYESWTVPIAVLLSLPVAALGAYLGVWVCGLENDVYFQIGLVMLVGLAAKNAILIVEFAKVQVDKGEDLVQSAIYAAKLRFRPILMTSLAFVLGMLPMVLASGPGSASRQAIGTGVFFGMIFAIVFGIILVPFFFVMVYKTKSKILKHKK